MGDCNVATLPESAIPRSPYSAASFEWRFFRIARCLFEMLKSQGMQMSQAVTFLSDGGDTVRDLQMYLNPQAEHLLDWFHITMRLTVMGQMAKSNNTNDQTNLSAEVEKELERLKWNLWHGNGHKALQIVDDLEFALDIEGHGQEQRKLLKAVGEFGTYISANPNLYSQLRRPLSAWRNHFHSLC